MGIRIFMTVTEDDLSVLKRALYAFMERCNKREKAIVLDLLGLIRAREQEK